MRRRWLLLFWFPILLQHLRMLRPTILLCHTIFSKPMRNIKQQHGAMFRIHTPRPERMRRISRSIPRTLVRDTSLPILYPNQPTQRLPANWIMGNRDRTTSARQPYSALSLWSNVPDQYDHSFLNQLAFGIEVKDYFTWKNCIEAGRILLSTVMRSQVK